MDKRRGFTLVELLVVIAIIALLMSILMPALGRVRRQAKSVLCQSNMKQWGNCYAMYADVWEGSTPPGWLAGTSLAEPEDYAKCYWMEALRPYYGNEHDLRLCAMATKPRSRTGAVAGTFTAWGIVGDPGQLDRIGEPSNWPYAVIGDYGSTGNNGWIADPPPNVTPDDLGENHPVAWNWRNFNISGAGQVPMHGGNQWIDVWPMVTDEIPLFEGESWNTSGYQGYTHMVRICLNRHDGFVNWVFMDYSVRPVGLKELWRFKWHRRYDVNSDKAPTMQEFNTASGNYDGWLKKFKNYE